MFSAPSRAQLVACWIALIAAAGFTFPTHAQVVISEFLARNSDGLKDDDGEPSDWIELFNPSSTTVNLQGWALTDATDAPQKWRFPAVSLPPQAYLVVFASGKNRATPGTPLHTSFNLSGDGEYLALVQPDGRTIASEFSPTFPEQHPDISYGTSQSVTVNTLISPRPTVRFLVPTASSPTTATWTAPTFNDTAWTTGTSGLGFEGTVPGFNVKNVRAAGVVNSIAVAKTVLTTPAQQLRTSTETAASLNYLGTSSEGHYGNNRNFPGATTGADEDNFVVEATGTITFPSSGPWTFGVNSDDGFELTIGTFTLAFPSPRGPTDSLGVFNVPAAGTYPIRLVYFEQGGGSGLELFAGRGSLTAWSQTAFQLVGDTANGGLAVVSTPGSAAGGTYASQIGTDLSTRLRGVNSSLYVRIPFQVNTPADLQSLTLGVRYDDGFIAYLNGREVARRNAPASPAWNSAATSQRSRTQALQPELISLSEFRSSLVPGANVLAVHALNASTTDDTFLFQAELAELRFQEGALSYFAQPSPAAPNNSGFVAFVDDTRFSHDRGFYSAPFELRITSGTTNATIMVTTNGTPPSLTNGFAYTNPILINGTRVVRAAAFKTGFQPSNIDTHTYLFVDDIINQSPDRRPPPGWPTSWGANTVDYGMDPRVVTNSLYAGTIRNDLKSLPSISIVTDLNHLFNPTTGIYANPGQDGRAWERPCSAELINPDGSRGFQIDAGLRIRGGFSRSTSNPKHALRLFFREEYGTSKLKYPMFGDQGTDTFDALDLRTFQNYSWSFGGDSRGVFIRDQFSRDAQLAMGHNAERGNYYHLYINGTYWGLYNTCERPEASYGQTYLGGNKEDYDVIKVEAGPYTIGATDGTMDAWTRLYNAGLAGFQSNAAYFRVQGKNPDGTPNPAYENLVDLPNLIDYMLVILFGGNLDAPISNFLGNTRPNNWYGMRNRTGEFGGFRFFSHDAEHTLLNLNEDRTGPYTAGDSSVVYSSPQWIWQKLQANAEFRLLVADHVHRHFFNNGVLTPESAKALFYKRVQEIQRAVVAESARWGDSKTATPLTRNANWIPAVNSVSNYLHLRPAVVLSQLRNDSLYPATAAPSFSQFGGNVQPGYPLSITTTGGSIYYTLDGSDPRLIGGSVSDRARPYQQPIPITQSTRVLARTLNGTTWSALTAATFTPIQTFTELRITEIMFNPPAALNLDGDEFEFIELKNISTRQLDLSGIRFTNGISFTFPQGSLLNAGQFLILASNPDALRQLHPNLPIFAAYQGRLANTGETLSLIHAAGNPIMSVTFSDSAPWPPLADGRGFSLVPVSPNSLADANSAAYWRPSSRINGSPGADDPPANVTPVWITEVLTHTDPPLLDSIEIHNPSTLPADISHWYLTDDAQDPKKFRIPPGTIIPAGGYRVFTETEFNPQPGTPPSFSLDSHGESVFIHSADASGQLTGYVDGFTFDAAENPVTFGRHTTSDNRIVYPPQERNSLGSPNAGPKSPTVAFNEINYAPGIGLEEFIEIRNNTPATLPLYDPAFPTNRWRIEGIGFDFPPNTQLAPGQLALVVPIAPSLFRSRFGVPANIPIYGPYTGTLQDNGETLSLQRPDAPDLLPDGSTLVPYITIDTVRYNDRAPWPIEASGAGASLERTRPGAFGDDPANWRASFGAPSPGIENDGNRAPRITLQDDLNLAVPGFPLVTNLTATVSDDGLPSNPGRLTITWAQTAGPATATLTQPGQASTTASFPLPGRYTFTLSATDGALTSSANLTIELRSVPKIVPLVAAGSTWKYLEGQADPGTTWISPSFNDTTWRSGPAQLGYGDNDEATVINSATKYAAYYFRHRFTLDSQTSVQDLTLRLLRDDGGIVYLNGTEVFRSNMPEGLVTFSTFASEVVGDAAESAFYEKTVDPSLLLKGENTLAVEIHQQNLGSTDLGFDLELIAALTPTAPATNQPPTVTAGPDTSVTLPASLSLTGSVLDDGRPNPPAKTSSLWSKTSGPGNAIFLDVTNPRTSVTFSSPGTYVLRLTAADGELTAFDEITINAQSDTLSAWKASFFNPTELANPSISGDNADPDLDNLTNFQEFTAGTHPRDPASVLKLGVASITPSGPTLNLQVVAGKTYTLQYRDNLNAASWTRLVNLAPAPTTGTITVQDPSGPLRSQRFYRVVTPALP